MLIKNLKSVVEKILLGNLCILCKKDKGSNKDLCTTCYNKLKREKRLNNKDRVYYSYIYDGEIRDLILSYKKKGNAALGETIARLIRADLKKVIEDNQIDVVIPVPLSKERELERGFNQIEVLLDLLKIKYRKIYRIKNTHYMASLKNYDERKNNIQNAFFSDIILDGKKILVVDDIVTSGSTISEIEATIKEKANNSELTYYTICISKLYIKGGK